jgi:multidrug resistance protein
VNHILADSPCTNRSPQLTLAPAVIKDIATAFGTTATVVNLSVGFYSLAVAFTPLWWSYFSERYGRRAIYLISFVLLVIFNVLSAISVNIGMFIAMRILAGGACASVQAVGAGTISDLWDVKERGSAMGIFFLGPMLGPLLSPIIGGAVAIEWGWRSTQWVMVIYAALVFILVLVLLPETSTIQHGPKDKTIKKIKNGTIIQRSLTSTAFNAIIGPIRAAYLLRFMPILITVFYNAITFASYYLVNITIQTVFSRAPYSYSALIVGLTYIPSALGAILGSFCGGRWTDYIMRREANKASRYDENGSLQFIPQDRMRENVWIGALLYPAAMVWFGWAADKGIFWFVLVGTSSLYRN